MYELKPKILFVHGYVGTPENVWFSWLRNELEKRGHEVFAPQMPRPAHPQFEEWVATILLYLDKIGENGIVIAHSLGAKAALHALGRHEKKIRHLFLIAPLLDQDYHRPQSIDDNFIRMTETFWNQPLNVNRIDCLTFTTAIFSDDDPCITSFDEANDLSINWDIKYWDGFGHFCNLKIPRLFDLIVPWL